MHVAGVVGEKSARKWRDGAADNEGQNQLERRYRNTAKAIVSSTDSYMYIQ